MAELSGVAKLSNGDPASQIVAVHPLRGHVRTAVPAPDGSYAIPGVPKGKWLVTAEGPAGYRPLTHVLDVERVPEAEALYPKVWEAWSFDGSLVGDRRGSTLNGTSTHVFTSGRVGQAVRKSAGSSWTYSPGMPAGNCTGFSAWIYRGGTGAMGLPSIHASDSANIGDANVLVRASLGSLSQSLVVEGRLSTAGAFVTLNAPYPTDGNNAWVHVVVLVTPAGLTVWVDGVKSSAIATIEPGGILNRMALRPANMGATDDLVMFVVAPTEGEVLYLYSNGAGRTWGQLVEDAGFD